MDHAGIWNHGNGADDQLHEDGLKRRLMYSSRLVSDLLPELFRVFCQPLSQNPPKVVVVEAEAAACLYKGAAAGDGDIRIVDGDMPTIMAGLACGEPNTISWDILKNHVDTFVAAPDWVAAKGMRMLAAPIKEIHPVTSGESGAAPFGTLACIMCMEEYRELREHLGLDETSRVLLFSTEGTPILVRYQSIVWTARNVKQVIHTFTIFYQGGFQHGFQQNQRSCTEL